MKVDGRRSRFRWGIFDVANILWVVLPRFSSISAARAYARYGEISVLDDIDVVPRERDESIVAAFGRRNRKSRIRANNSR